MFRLGVCVLAAAFSCWGTGTASADDRAEERDLRGRLSSGAAAAVASRSTQSSSPHKTEGGGWIGAGDDSSRRVEEVLVAMQREMEALKEHNAILQRKLDALEKALGRTNSAAIDNDAEEEGSGAESVPRLGRRRRRLPTSVSVAEFNKLQKTVQGLAKRLACVSAKSDGNDLVLEGCNVHVQNGLRDTLSENGKGNLIVGYNPMSLLGTEAAQRTGSHNVVVGDRHRWTSHSGIVAGFNNYIGARWTAALGGTYVGCELRCWIESRRAHGVCGWQAQSLLLIRLCLVFFFFFRSHHPHRPGQRGDSDGVGRDWWPR